MGRRSELVFKLFKETTPQLRDPLMRFKRQRLNQDIVIALSEEAIEFLEMISPQVGIQAEYLVAAAMTISNLNPFTIWFESDTLEGMIPELIEEKIPPQYWFWCASELGIFGVFGIDALKLGYDKNPANLLCDRFECAKYGAMKLKHYISRNNDPIRGIVRYCMKYTKFRFKDEGELKEQIEICSDAYRKLCEG